MLFSGYKVEILVNDRPLEECSEYIEKEKPMTTGPSYVYNELTMRKTESDLTHYAVVVDPGAHFKIRYEVPVNSTLPGPIMAMVYVDGRYDYTYVPIIKHEERIQVKDGFTHVTKNVKYGFKFDVMSWGENEKSDDVGKNEFDDTEFQIPKIGGLGSISVCFYRADHYYQRIKPIEYDIKRPAIPEETKDLNLEFRFATSFDEISIPTPTPLESVLKQISNQPLAVIHLHYRSKSWLVDRDILKTSQELPVKREILPGLSLPLPSPSIMPKNLTLPISSNVCSPSIHNNILTEATTHSSISNITDVDPNSAVGCNSKKQKDCKKSLEVKNKIDDSKNSNIAGTNDSTESEVSLVTKKTLTKADLKKWWSRWKSSRSENIDPGQKRSKNEVCDENKMSSALAPVKGRDKKKRKITDSDEIILISSD
ncbi:14323_t:CDS:2 [Acaulospora morrowiae]|uniref:14323_t:CDS:1 n=1 Tax=Acaulospora morrowiae TaxID=94023 RepID=A0A9N9C0F3_9GLOM|nr:14323_t:CDS:2 [Acaulospora morrowiae]